MTRRALLGSAARLGLGASMLGALETLAEVPVRAAAAERRSLPDIQFDTGAFTAPARTVDGVVVRFPPVYTSYTTIALRRTPTRADQARLTEALRVVERALPFSPRGVFTTVAYGIPYFERLSGGLIAGAMPRLLSDPNRLVLEEAVPGPTDVSPANPGVTKATFHVPVAIESNDMLLILRSDTTAVIDAVLAYLTGAGTRLGGGTVGRSGLGGLPRVTSRRLIFQQIGLPRRLADRHRLPFAGQVSRRSPMWMGFTDQQVTGSGPPAITTFAGSPSARLTTARAGDYFHKGSIVHLSHLIEDLGAFYAEPLVERAQCMFRSNPVPVQVNARGAAPRPRSTSGPTGPGSTRWTCRTDRSSRSFSSPSSSRPPTSSPGSGATRPHSTSSSGSPSIRAMRGSSASSRRPAARTSSSRPGATGRSRSSSSRGDGCRR